MSSPATLASAGSAPQRASRPRRYGGGPESPFSSRNVSLKSSPATLAGHTATTAADEGGSEWVVQGGGLADGSRAAGGGGGGVSLGAAAVPSAASGGGRNHAASSAPLDDERFPRPATAGSYKPAGGHGSPNGVSSSKSRGPSRSGAAGAAASPPGSPVGAAGMRSSSAVDPATSLADDDHKPIVAERFKTKMCKNWKDTGSCPYEIRCMFAHGDADFRTKEMNLAENLTTEEAVKVFQRGKSEKEGAAGGGGNAASAASRGGAKAGASGAGSAGGGRTSRNGPATPGGLRGAATSGGNKSTASPRSATTKGNGTKGGSAFDAGSPFGGGGHSSSRFEPLSPGGAEPRPPQPRSSQRSSAERNDATPPTVHPQQPPQQQQQQPQPQGGSSEKGDGLPNASFAAVTPGTAPSSASSTHGFTLLDGVANLPGSIKGGAVTSTTTTSTGPTGQHNTSGGSDYNFIRDHTATTSTRSGSQDQQQHPPFAYDFGSAIAASNAQQQQLQPSGQQQHGSIAHTAATWGDPLRPSLLVPGSAGDATNSSTANQTPRNSMVGGGSSDVDPDDDELHRLVSAVLNQTA